jgi:CAAX protease family protein
MEISFRTYCTTNAGFISFAILFESGYIQPAMTRQDLLALLDRVRPFLTRPKFALARLKLGIIGLKPYLVRLRLALVRLKLVLLGLKPFLVRLKLALIRLKPYLIRLRPYFFQKDRLRSGWRIALYLLTSLSIFLVFERAFESIIAYLWSSRGISSAGIDLLMTDFETKPFNYPDVAFGFFIIRTGITLALIWGFRRWIDKRRFASLGFKFTHDWWHQMGAGFGFVLITWAAIFLLALAFRGATIVGFAWDVSDTDAILGALAVGLVFNLLVGLVEEADARGYILQNLADGIRLIPAIAVSSFYFGALHALNPGAGWLSTIGVFIAGVLLAAGYYVTKQLWFSIGMHAAWNFAEGPIFGFPVSGLGMGGLFQLRINGPEWLMGGVFGPEAGLLTIAVELVMIAELVVWANRKEWQVHERVISFYNSPVGHIQKLVEMLKSKAAQRG